MKDVHFAGARQRKMTRLELRDKTRLPHSAKTRYKVTEFSKCTGFYGETRYILRKCTGFFESWMRRRRRANTKLN